MKREKTLKEIQDALGKEGIDLNRNQVDYYQKHRLLPRPAKRVGGRGHGLYGYNPKEFTRAAKMVLKLKAEGLTVPKIKKALSARMLNLCYETLREIGINDMFELTTQQLMGVPLNVDMYMKTLKEKKVENPQGCLSDIRRDRENQILRRVKFWWADSEIESAVLMYVIDRVDDVDDALHDFNKFIMHKEKQEKQKPMVQCLLALQNDIKTQRRKLDNLMVECNTKLQRK